MQYGYVGLENEGVVYFVYIVDYSTKTDGDTVSDGVYYMAEFDGETRALLFETGTLFESEEEKGAAVERLLDMIDELK